MFFAIFKLPRTGSTRIVKYLDRTTGVRCVHEILNGCEGNDYQTAIETQLGPVPTQKKWLGFSLNPFKHSIKSTEFFNPHHYIHAQGQGLVISLVRDNVFQQAASFWLSTQMQMWPGDADAAKAAQLQSHIQQGGIEIPAEKFRRLCNRFFKQNQGIVNFSREYAARYKLDHLALTYEGIYDAPNSDLAMLENELGIALSRDLIIPSKKVLPQPQDWIENFNDLAHSYARYTS